MRAEGLPDRAGNPTQSLLIKSESPERKTLKSVLPESTEEIGSERSDRVGNTEGKRPEESLGRMAGVSTKEASVP
ncbi:hypothetical protein ACFVW2_16005, partial [Streptomyces sp. NPDC058171]